MDFVFVNATIQNQNRNIPLRQKESMEVRPTRGLPIQAIPNRVNRTVNEIDTSSRKIAEWSSIT